MKKQIINLDIFNVEWNKKTLQRGVLTIWGMRGKYSSDKPTYIINIKITEWLPKVLIKLMTRYLVANLKRANEEHLEIKEIYENDGQ